MAEKSLSEIYRLYKNDPRIADYRIYEKLYNAQHYSAFSIKSEDFKDEYARLRYVVCNFAGLVSKVIADMLFGEPVSFKDENNQDFINNLIFEKDLNVLFYEHSLANSYFGDNLFKIRVAKDEIFIEDTPPALYMPDLPNDNTRAKPEQIYLMWKVQIGKTTYAVFEIHKPPFVITKAAKILKNEEAEVEEITIEAFNKLAGTSYVPEVDTKINRFLVKHVPNPKARGHFGNSDYVDLKQLIFALNNRMSKVDNILDKHSDPILAIPEGVVDEEGSVKKEAFNMFEMDESGNKPEYIVWNANLDSAFKQIDKIVEFLFMFSETSPDVLGMGKGQAESGRALKMRLLRTIAKRNRKKLYYDKSIRDVIFTAELLSEKNGYIISQDFKNIKAKKSSPPETTWQDGVVNDEVERTEIVIKKTESGLMSKKRGIMELEGVTDKEAKEIIKEVNEGKADFNSLLDKKPNVKSNDGR